MPTALCCVIGVFLFLFKQKTAYEMRSSDWSSDVCSSDLTRIQACHVALAAALLCCGTAATASWNTARWQAAYIAIPPPPDSLVHAAQIGRASCRERVCQYV